jgi:hypothetical protein
VLFEDVREEWAAHNCCSVQHGYVCSVKRAISVCTSYGVKDAAETVCSTAAMYTLLLCWSATLPQLVVSICKYVWCSACMRIVCKVIAGVLCTDY